MNIPTFKHLLKDNSYVLLTMFLAYLANYVLNVFLARHLTPTDYADFSVAFGVIKFLVPFALLGTQAAGLRYLPRYSKEKLWSRFKGFMNWSNKVFFVMLVIVIVIATLLVLLAFYLDLAGITSLDAYHPLIYFIWLVPLYAFIALQSAILQSLSRYTRSVIYVSLLFPIALVLFLFTLLRWIEKINIYHVLFLVGITSLLIAGIQTISIKRMLPKEIKKYPPEYEKTRWFKAALTLLQPAALKVGIMTLGLVLLEVLGHSEQIVAEYAVITTIQGFILLIQTSINVVVSPLISAYRTEAAPLQFFVRKANVLQLILGSIVFLFILFAGRFLIDHFGAHYEDPSIYLYLMIISVVSFIGSILLGLPTTVLLYSKHVVKLIKLAYVQFFLTLILQLVLIPYYSIWGAIIGYSVGLLVYYLWAAILARRLIGIKTSLLM